MATALTIQTGLTVTPTANAADATGNYVVPVDARQELVLRFNNPTGGSLTVTLDDVNSVSPVGAQSFTPDVQLAVPAAASRYFVLTAEDLVRFLSTANGRVSWTYSAAGLTVEVIGV